MSADALTTIRPIATGVLTDQRRSLLLWSVAVGAVAAMYIAFYPSINASDLTGYIESLPEGMVEAFNYDQIGSAAGYLSSTVYGVLGPALLLVYGVMKGSRLIAGEEEDGTLELDLTAPVSRLRLFFGRLAGLWLNMLILVAVLTVVTVMMVGALDMDVAVGNILAGSLGLLLLVVAVATVAAAAGAITGRRAIAVGVGAGLAVAAFMLNAIGPTVDAGWMTAISPFSWYSFNDPLTNGVDVPGYLGLAALIVVAAAAGAYVFDRRDLMV
ncbi:ABC transporter permease [soil metagenome]